MSLHVFSVSWSGAGSSDSDSDSVVLANVGAAVAMVACAELLVDWIKHAFVIKVRAQG